MRKCLVSEYIIDKCASFDNVSRVGLLGLGKLKSYIIGLYPVEKVFIYYISNSKLVFWSNRFDAVWGRGVHFQEKKYPSFQGQQILFIRRITQFSWTPPPSSKNKIHQCCYIGINTKLLIVTIFILPHICS